MVERPVWGVLVDTVKHGTIIVRDGVLGGRDGDLWISRRTEITCDPEMVIAAGDWTLARVVYVGEDITKEPVKDA